MKRLDLIDKIIAKKIAPFSYEWLSRLHKEMFGDVWDWAGKFRQIELSIGIRAYQVPTAPQYILRNKS